MLHLVPPSGGTRALRCGDEIFVRGSVRRFLDRLMDLAPDFRGVQHSYDGCRAEVCSGERIMCAGQDFVLEEESFRRSCVNCFLDVMDAMDDGSGERTVKSGTVYLEEDGDGYDLENAALCLEMLAGEFSCPLFFAVHAHQVSDDFVHEQAPHVHYVYDSPEGLNTFRDRTCAP